MTNPTKTALKQSSSKEGDCMGYDIKTIKRQFKQQGIFYTPPELAELLKSYIDINVTEVYDPTCGRGNLLSVFDDNVIKYGQDINVDEIKIAKRELKNFVGVAGDTLKEPAFKGKKFSAIVANPPFSIKWEPQTDERFADAPTVPTESKADYAFILHILHYLSDDGIAIALNFPGILYRGGREGKIREWIIKNNWIDKVISIPEKTFIDTTISTCLIVFKKNKTTTDIEFIDNGNKLSRVVDVKEVSDNGYSLSVSNYVAPEIIKEHVDPLQLEDRAQKEFIAKLKQELEFSKMVCGVEGLDFSVFVNELQAVLDTYKTARL